MRQIEKQPILRQALLIGAQFCSLAALLLGLQFLINTTGGTLFAFSSLGPVLVLGSIVIVAGVGIHTFLKQHSLFDFTTFKAGEIIFRQGEPGDCAYFIESGAVEVLRGNGSGDSKVVAQLADGQYFGEMALLSSEPRNATIRAAAPTRVAILGKENFLKMCNLIPSAQADILQTFKDRAMQEAGVKFGPKPTGAN